MFCDASNSGIGSALFQADSTSERILKPIGYFSKTLNSTQRRYSVTKREFLTIHLSLKEFQHIILGYPITILTDHKPICGFFGKRLPLDSAMARWSIEATVYDCEIKYFEGKRNVVADTLSRLEPLKKTDINNCDLLQDTNKDTNSIEAYIAQTRSKAKQIVQNEITPQTEPLQNSRVNKEIPFLPYIPSEQEISWSINTLKSKQQNDPFCKDIINCLQKKQVCTVKDITDYFLLDGVLYKHRNIDTRPAQMANYVIPTDLMKIVITSLHYNTHCGTEHTLFRFRLHYFHPQERTLIHTHIRNCDICKILKSPLDTPIKLLSAPIAHAPFQTVSFDIIGPLIVTDNNNKYILSITDMFSRYCVLHAVPNKSTDTIIQCLNETFNNYGFPKTLMSNNALEFVSKSVQTYAKLHQIYKCEVLPYSAFSNGLCERNNRRINTLLRYYVHTVQHCNWDTFLNTVQNTLNNQINVTLKDTPSFVMFQRDTMPNLLTDEIGPLYNTDDTAQIVKIRARESAIIQEQIRANIINQTNKRTLYHNTNRIDKTLAIGDRILLRNHQKSHKLSLNWLGPGKHTDIRKNKCVVQIGNKLITCNKNLLIKLSNFR